MKFAHNYLLLMRPANMLTAVADVLAGIAISGIFLQWTFDGLLTAGVVLEIVVLCIASGLLYAGGIIFNDVLSYRTDVIERPESVIARGALSLTEASSMASMLMAFGVLFALFVHTTAGWIAILIVIAALVYNKWAKHHSTLGPQTMGL